MWDQIYDPLNSKFLSTCAAALPVITLLALIASNKVKAHIAALVALVVANFIAIVVFTMPADMSLRATVLGAITGFFPIGWIVLNVIFLYRLTVEKGAFQTLQTTIGGVTEDRRLQLLLIAFSFGAFFEGASGFGTPVAVTGAILIGLGFSPLAASGLITDRQYRARRLRRPWHSDRRPCKRHRPRPISSGRDGRTAAAIFLADRSILVDLGVRRVSRHERNLAGDPGHRCFLRHSAIPHLELHQSVDRRHRRFAHLNGLPHGFLKIWRPKVVWTSPALRTRDDLRGHDAKEAGEGNTGTDDRRGVVLPAAVDHRLHHPAAVGHQRGQRHSERLGDAGIFRFRACTT